MSENMGLSPCYILSNVKCHDGLSVQNYDECMNDARGGIDGADGSLGGGSAKPYECEGYRLATEAEWEYAVRAGSNTAFYPSAGNNGTISVAKCTPVDPNLNQIAW